MINASVAIQVLPDVQGEEVIRVVRRFHHDLGCKTILLRGNHEDAWLRVIDDGGWLGFTLPESNGCRECMRSFQPPGAGASSADEFGVLHTGSFFPPDVVEWMRAALAAGA